MQFRFPASYILVFLYLFVRAEVAVSLFPGVSLLLRDGDDDGDNNDDDESDNDSSSRHNHGGATGTPAPLTSHRVDKGAIAGIVLGCLLLLLLLVLMSWWCIRRRRSTAKQQAVPLTMKEASSAPLLTPLPTLRSISMDGMSPTGVMPVTGPTHLGRRGMHEIPLDAVNSTPLPNPYDGDRPPLPPPRDDVFISSPTSIASNSASWYGNLSSSSNRRSTAPSAWTHDENIVLSRGGTQSSRLTMSSSLHEELTGYQKALEAHHRKESEDATSQETRIGEGSVIPTDPPPVYSASHEG